MGVRVAAALAAIVAAIVYSLLYPVEEVKRSVIHPQEDTRKQKETPRPLLKTYVQLAPFPDVLTVFPIGKS